MLSLRIFSRASLYLTRSTKFWNNVALQWAKGALQACDSLQRLVRLLSRAFAARRAGCSCRNPYTALSLALHAKSIPRSQPQTVNNTHRPPHRHHHCYKSQHLPSRRLRVQSVLLPSCLPQSAIAKLVPIPACTRHLSVATKFRMRGEFFF